MAEDEAKLLSEGEKRGVSQRPGFAKAVTVGNIDRGRTTTESRFHCVVGLTPPGEYQDAGTAVRLGPRHMLTVAHCLGNGGSLSVCDVSKGIDSTHIKPIARVYLETGESFVLGRNDLSISLNGKFDLLTVLELDDSLAGVTATVQQFDRQFQGDTLIATSMVENPGSAVLKFAVAKAREYDERTLVVDKNDVPLNGFSTSSGTPMFLGDGSPLKLIGVLSRVNVAEEQGYYEAMTSERVNWLSQFIQ